MKQLYVKIMKDILTIQPLLKAENQVKLEPCIKELSQHPCLKLDNFKWKHPFPQRLTTSCLGFRDDLFSNVIEWRLHAKIKEITSNPRYTKLNNNTFNIIVDDFIEYPKGRKKEDKHNYTQKSIKGIIEMINVKGTNQD
jgi:hypothetical protein